MTEVDASLIAQFNKDNNMYYNKNDDNHKYLLNEYFKKNFDEWAEEYNKILSNYGMEVKFINAKKYNIN